MIRSFAAAAIAALAGLAPISGPAGSGPAGNLLGAAAALAQEAAPEAAPQATPPAAPAPAPAPIDEDAFSFAGDVFRSGGAVVFSGAGARDVFLAGERVELAAPVSGSAHLAGRRVQSAAAVGGALYASGAFVEVSGPVSGAATLAGYDLAVSGAIGGNLRAFGSNIDIKAPVGGGALVFGDHVELAAPVLGDAMIGADALSFGEGARVDGKLILLEEPGRAAEVPASVAPPERIERRAVSHGLGMTGPGWLAIIAGLLLGAVVLAILATLVPTIAPWRTARLAAIAAEGPLRTLGAGFLALAALIGAALLLVATLVGVVVAPFALLAALALGLLGYVVGVYLLGAWAVIRFGGLEPDTFPEYALAGVIGAVAATLLALLPFVGWLVILALTFTGAGAVAISTLRPRDAYGR